MLEFIAANWFWLLIVAGLVWFVFRKASDDRSSHSSHGSESRQTKAPAGDDEANRHVDEQPRYSRRRRAGGC